MRNGFGLAGLTLALAVGAAQLGAIARAADDYLIGRGTADITGPSVGLKMLGYVRPDQITAGIHLRQWSRAFVVAQPDGRRRLAIVTTDLQSVTHSLVLSVLERLQTTLGAAYGLENTIIAATHTHAVPGGYWHYGADTPLGTPFYQEYFDALVESIAASIISAHNDLRPGSIRIARGPVQDAGAQRSQTAYLQNPADERQRYGANIDAEMTLLRFDTAAGPIGVLNWHAVHPTSMSYRNRLISGDNKGYAAYAMERAHAAGGAFVAAFAQSNCGDVTPNLTLDQKGPGADEFESTRLIGQRQFEAAQRLFEAADERLTGPIDYRHSYVNFTSLEVADDFTHAGKQSTCPAAYGYSFAAGSTEDGGGQPLFKEGMRRTDPFIETLAKAVLPLPPAAEALRRVHQPKPILLAIGTADPPVLPQVLPLGVARIGQLAIVVGPAEFTTMSGRRFRASVQRGLPQASHVVVAGYANDYAGYVATREEYEAQHYEGAATLYGPWTQAGYQQEFARLAADLAAGRQSRSGAPPVDVRGTVRPTRLGTVHDAASLAAEFGALRDQPAATARRGETVTASFWTGNPQNGYRPDRRYVRVERWDGSAWKTVAADGDWALRLRWSQPAAGQPGESPDPLGAHLLAVEWRVPQETAEGRYRIVHAGTFKSAADRRLHEFEAHSQPTELR